MSTDADDRRFQEMAVEEARASRQEKAPTLFVGAVVVRDGIVIAKAHRGQISPGDHAEFTALEKHLGGSNQTAANCTVYTTLEPCTVRGLGKIACAQRLIDHQVRRVVVGTIDPNVDIRGGGVKMLQQRGIEVQLFDHDLVRELHALNRAFERHHASPPIRLAPRISSLTNQDTPEDACLEFLRLENLYAPREPMDPLFNKAVVITDDAGERAGWDVVTIRNGADDFKRALLRFSAETARVVDEKRLGRHYLVAVAVADNSSLAEKLARDIASACVAQSPRLGVFVFVGWMAHRTFVPHMITGA